MGCGEGNSQIDKRLRAGYNTGVVMVMELSMVLEFVRFVEKKYVHSRMSYQWNKAYKGSSNRYKIDEAGYNECKRLGVEGIKCE